jgi:hypothetical protein
MQRFLLTIIGVLGFLLIAADHFDYPFWDDVTTPAAKLKASSVGAMAWGSFPVGGSTNTWIAGDTTLECVEGAIQLPHSYKLGTNLLPHTHWSPFTTSTGSISWRLDYTLQSMGGVYSAGSTIYTTGCSGFGVANKHQFCSLPTISGSGIDLSAIMIYRICRDGAGVGGSDTLTGTAALLAFDVHVQKDTPGSYTELVK